MGDLKGRLSVIFSNSDELAGNLEHNDTYVTVKGSGQLVQKRITQSFNKPEEPENRVRITWKHSSSIDSNVIKPQLLDGLNIYTVGSEHDFAVATPRYYFTHSDKFEIDLINKFSVTGLKDFDFKWQDRDYDIVFTDSLRIDEYYTLDDGITETFGIDGKMDKMEAGFFFIESQENTDVNLNGIRCMWNSDGSIENCQKTYLFYQAAHSNLQEAITTLNLSDPVGLHPTLNIDLTKRSSMQGCEYYAYMLLPIDIFVDKYQSSPIFVFGEHDLEMPAFKLKNGMWGSEALFQLTAGQLNEIKLHSRYVEPVRNGKFKSVKFDSLVFQACDSGNDEVQDNPFYNRELGYELYFTKDTIFRHLNSTELMLQIPAANINDYGLVQRTTIACIFFSIMYLLAKLFKVDSR